MHVSARAQREPGQHRALRARLEMLRFRGEFQSCSSSPPYCLTSTRAQPMGRRREQCRSPSLAGGALRHPLDLVSPKRERCPIY